MAISSLFPTSSGKAVARKSTGLKTRHHKERLNPAATKKGEAPAPGREKLGETKGLLL